MQMNPYVYDWVIALRSGNYVQAHGAMVAFERSDPDRKKHCCLGVAADVHGCEFDPPLSEGWSHYVKLGVIDPHKGGRSSMWKLPLLLREKLGITSDDCQALASLNDKSRLSFNEIADVIEEACHFNISIVEVKLRLLGLKHHLDRMRQVAFDQR